MNGEELYQVYVDANDHYNTGVDGWHDLNEVEHDMWNKMAELLEAGRST